MIKLHKLCIKQIQYQCDHLLTCTRVHIIFCDIAQVVIVGIVIVFMNEIICCYYSNLFV